jgi:hypothetical protein
MPFDPFFSSANKKHYIPNPEFAALKAKVKAMSSRERDAWAEETAKKIGDRTTTLIEAQVLKALRWEWGTAARTKQRWRAERFAMDLSKTARVHGVVVLHGQSTTGTKCGPNQGHASKAVTHKQGAPTTHVHVYERKRKGERRLT